MNSETRIKMVRVISDYIDTWEWVFTAPTAAICRAIVDKRISSSAILAYPIHNRDQARSNELHARSLVLAAGLTWYDEETRQGTTLDEVEVAVTSLVGLVGGCAGIEEGVFGLHEETLTGHALTLDDFRIAAVSLSILEAARLMVDAFDLHKKP